MTIDHRPGAFWRIMTAAALGVAVVLTVAVSPAQAASASAGKDNFAGACDAQVHVSDATTFGRVEGFGGFSCPTGVGLLNEPSQATITIMIFRNGVEVIRSHYDIPTCIRPTTCSTDSHSVTYPDYASTDRFKSRMQITSLSGSVTLTTAEIST